MSLPRLPQEILEILVLVRCSSPLLFALRRKVRACVPPDLPFANCLFLQPPPLDLSPTLLNLRFMTSHDMGLGVENSFLPLHCTGVEVALDPAVAQGPRLMP